MPEKEGGRRYRSLKLDDREILVGKNSRGNWVARDQSGLCGGLFKAYAPALKFALSENGNRREDVIVVTGPLELDMAAA